MLKSDENCKSSVPFREKVGLGGGEHMLHSMLFRTYFDGRLQRNSISNQLPTMEQLNIRPEIRFEFKCSKILL